MPVANAPPVRAVLDTSVLVSGIVSTRVPAARILDAARVGTFTLIALPSLLDELLDVLLRPQFGISVREAAGIVATIRNRSQMIRGAYLGVEMVPTDPKDNHVPACALEGDAQYLVTEDRHDLLPLKDHRVAGHRVLHVVRPGYFVGHLLGGAAMPLR